MLVTSFRKKSLPIKMGVAPSFPATMHPDLWYCGWLCHGISPQFWENAKLEAKHQKQKKKHTLALCLPTWHSHGPWRKIPLASRVDLWSFPVWYIVTTSCCCAVLLACLCIEVTFWWPFFLNSNQVMLSFGAAPASSCGRGNSSALPDYLPEEDDSVVISDKVSKRHGK